MSHHHHHHHDHAPTNYHAIFGIGVGLNLAYIVLEVVFGFRIDSLALLADAGHNLGDVLSLLLSWGAAYLAGVAPTRRRTYGWRKFSVLAALFNSLLLLVAMGGITWEAVRRLRHPADVAGGVMMWVAAAGVLVNTATALLFLKGRKRDLNLKAAFLHMAADAGVSAGVVAAGLAILLTHLNWIDPAMSLVVVAVIVIGTWGLLRDSANLALDAVPEGINPAEIEAYLARLPGVEEVHDLHIWGMSTTETALTVHLIKPDAVLDDSLLSRACRDLHDRFGIEHATIQLESNPCDRPCAQAAPSAV